MLPWYIDLALGTLTVAMGVCSLIGGRPIIGAVNAALGSLLLFFAYLGHNVDAECKDAPPMVEFHQGMTLCPGQSATMRIIVPVGKDL